MVRPRKRRRLGQPPPALIYKPAGIPLSDLSTVRLLPEELESLRLSDLDGLEQLEAANRMGVSRSTYQRILGKARRQVALALCQGQALVIAEKAAVQESNGT